MNDVMVHVTRHEVWDSAVEYAADLAARLDGSLTGVFVQPSPLYMMPPYVSGDIVQAVVESARLAEAAAATRQDAFVAWATRIGARRAAWQVAEGAIPETLSHIGNWHDLVVLGRDAAQPWSGPAELGSIALASSRPCIIVPPAFRDASLGCIALAWNGSAEAMRSIHAALPLLRHAARVVLFDGGSRAAGVEAGWMPPFEIAGYLANHDVRAVRRDVDFEDEVAGERLLSAAIGEGANLLVMGAYGRSRFSEWVFGGATRTLLHSASLPLFMHH